MIMASVCSGILGAELAAPDHWESAWCAEIDPFASRVIAHHRPEMRNYGDFTTIGSDAGPVNILCGGTPCQSFSIAGERGGLADPRGNLSLEFASLAARVSARWILWENVPGVISSNGGWDVLAFFGALAELGYHLAYRILDAQFFGLAQRRRRVWVVGYFGDWRPPAAVLFEPEDVSRNSASSSQAGKGVAFGVKGGAGSQHSGCLGDPRRSDLDGIGAYIAFDAAQITSKANRSNPRSNDPSPPVCRSSRLTITNRSRVRKLTPLECERLQGFPDNWSSVPGSSNTTRYKVLGNAWPVPVARWIMSRIDTVNKVIQ